MKRFQNTRQPDWDWWEELWPEPRRTLRRVGLDAGVSVADVGCGNGYFTLPAADIVGTAPVYAIDIDEALLDEVETAAEARGITTIECITGDARQLESLLPDPVDLVLIANTFHGVEDKRGFVESAYRSLRPGGRFVIVNWHDRAPAETVVAGEPRGPPAELRLSPEETHRIVSTVPFESSDEITLQSSHYALIYQRE
jgi:ubiquinone/menaquinone biosynthesis C-methylase UbiE